MNLLASISGGRSSHLMAWILKNDPQYKDWNIIYCFGNTGKERTETLDFVHETDVRFSLGVVWIEAKVHYGERKACSHSIVSFHTAARKGEPFEAVIKKYGIPNASFPHCTRELKLNPIHSYAESVFGAGNYKTAMGIRADEASRIKIQPDFVYPLVERGIKVHAVRKFWNSMPFDLQLKDYEGNCDLCFKKSKRKLLTLLRDRPNDADWWRDIESKYKDVPVGDREELIGSVYFGRKNTPIDELIAESKNHFLPVYDPWFTPFNSTPEMDDEQPCNCMLQSVPDYEPTML